MYSNNINKLILYKKTEWNCTNTHRERNANIQMRKREKSLKGEEPTHSTHGKEKTGEGRTNTQQSRAQKMGLNEIK